MSARDLLDKTREKFIDADTSPTRSITYIRSSDDLSIPLNSTVGSGQFNKDEKERLEDWQTFGLLKLEEKPVVGDIVSYDSEEFKVQRWTKLGNLYTVYGRKSRHRGRG